MRGRLRARAHAACTRRDRTLAAVLRCACCRLRMWWKRGLCRTVLSRDSFSRVGASPRSFSLACSRSTASRARSASATGGGRNCTRSIIQSSGFLVAPVPHQLSLCDPEMEKNRGDFWLSANNANNGWLIVKKKKKETWFRPFTPSQWDICPHTPGKWFKIPERSDSNMGKVIQIWGKWFKCIEKSDSNTVKGLIQKHRMAHLGVTFSGTTKRTLWMALVWTLNLLTHFDSHMHLVLFVCLIADISKHTYDSCLSIAAWHPSGLTTTSYLPPEYCATELFQVFLIWICKALIDLIWFIVVVKLRLKWHVIHFPPDELCEANPNTLGKLILEVVFRM